MNKPTIHDTRRRRTRKPLVSDRISANVFQPAHTGWLGKPSEFLPHGDSMPESPVKVLPRQRNTSARLVGWDEWTPLPKKSAKKSAPKNWRDIVRK